MYCLKLAFIVFLLKSLDCCFNTIKSVFLYKDKVLISAIFNSISTFFYLVAITKLTKSNSIYVLIAMCFATFVGTYLPAKSIKNMEKDKVYIYDITAPNMEQGKEFADKMRNLNLAVNSYISYNKKMNKTLSCKVLSATKQQSRIIDKYTTEEFECIITPID